MQLKLDIGTIITTSGGKATGRVGAIVRNAKEAPLALTARHILEAEASEQVLEGTSGAVIGHKLHAPIPGAVIEAHNAIAALRIADGIGLEEGQILGCISPQSIKIGTHATLVSNDDLGCSGIVASLAGSVHFRDPFAQSTTHYLNIIEVVFDRSDVAELMRGRAGSLFISDDGLAIGLLIAVSGERCLLAPLEPYTSTHSLKVSSTRQTTLRDGRSVEGVPNVDLAELQAEASTMRDELRMEHTVFRDPEGLNPPEQLVKLLKEFA